MPLVDLKTKLKDLKFNGRPPYIQKDINNPGVPAANPIQARLDDSSRLTQLLLSAQGAQWAAKQVALEASKADTLAGALNINTAAIPAARLANMLLQIPVNGTGTHFISIGGAGIGNFYTRNINAASEAKNNGTVTLFSPDNRSRVKRSPRLTAWESGYENPKTSAGRQAKASSTVKLNRKTVLNDTKEGDRVNILQIGQTSKDDRIPVTFNLYGDTSSMLSFRGYVQNIQDNYTGTWNAVNYVGRMEQFFTYTGFTRTFGFQLTVPMFNEKEQPLVYNKVNSLVSYTAARYAEGTDLPQGNIIEMSLGNYIRTAGFISNVGITVQNDVPWSMSEPDAYGILNPRILPQVLILNIQFTPIHSKAPQLHVEPFNQMEAGDMPYFNHGEKHSDIINLPAKTPTLASPTGTPQLMPQINALPSLPAGFFQNLGKLFKKKPRPVVTTDDVEIYDIDDAFTSF